MVRRIPIDDLVWDDWNRAHAAKHGVREDEIYDVLDGPARVERSDKDRLVLIGSTGAGRVVAVVVGAVPDHPGQYYVFSAPPASPWERRRLAEEETG